MINMHLGESNYVWSGSFMPDGRNSDSGSKGTICTWDVDTGTILSGPFNEQSKWIWSAAFTPDGRSVVSISGGQTIMLDAMAEGLMSDSPIAGITSITFSLNHRRVASSSADRTIRIWHADTEIVICSPPNSHHTNRITSLGFSPDAKWVVSGSWDTTIYIWDADTGHVLYGPLRGHVRGINSVAFAPDGKRVVSGSDDRTLRIWDVEGEVVSGPFRGHTEGVTSVAFSPDGRLVASGSDDCTICIWDVMTGKSVCGLLGGHAGPVTSVSFSPSGDQVVSGSADRSIRVWDSSNGQLLLGPLAGHTGAIFSVAFSPDERCLLSIAVDQTIRIWRADPVENVSLNFSDEWMHCDPDSRMDEKPHDTRHLLFWVPPKYRRGICGGETVSIIGSGVDFIRVDFKRFEHGTSWERCCTPESSAALPLQLVLSQVQHINIVLALLFVLMAFSIVLYSYS
jgi:WD40 repeat protein